MKERGWHIVDNDETAVSERNVGDHIGHFIDESRTNRETIEIVSKTDDGSVIMGISDLTHDLIVLKPTNQRKTGDGKQIHKIIERIKTQE